MTTLVTELVPRLDHTGTVIEAVARFLGKLQGEITILSEGLVGIVPLRNVSSGHSERAHQNLPPNP